MTVTVNGSAFVLEENWDTLTQDEGEKLPLDYSGTPYHQGSVNYPDLHQSFVTTSGRGGSKALQFKLRPWSELDPTETNTDYDTGSQVWLSGLGLGDSSINGHVPVEGEETWCRLYVYFSPNWSWADEGAGSALKLFRLYPSTYYDGEVYIGVANTGEIACVTQGFTGSSLDLYGGANGALYGAGSDPTASGPATPFPIGSWFSLDLYIKSSATPANAMIRVWLNKTLILARDGATAPYDNRQTLNTEGATEVLGSPGVILYSTWDGRASLPNGAQSVLFDDIVVTNDASWVQAHGIQDAAGNWLIGAQDDPDSLRSLIKSTAVTNGMSALATVLDASPFKLPGGSTDNEKIVNAIVPLLGFEYLKQFGSNSVFPHPEGRYNRNELERYTQGSFNLIYTVYDRTRRLHEMADSTDDVGELQDILSNDVNQGWPE